MKFYALLPLTTSLVSAQLQRPLQGDDAISSVQRIAIIGAGPAGASTAYHLSQYASDAGVPINITMFDKNVYIGGRSTTVNALNDPRYPVELGASIFVELNSILVNATRDFKLPVSNKIYESTGARYDVGIWDGDGFVYLTETSGNADDEEGDGNGWKDRLAGWWDIAKLLWKYGLSPIRLRSVQQTTIAKFLRMYTDHFPFSDLTSTVEELDLTSSTSTSGADFLTESSVSDQFQREIVQAATRVNYAQNLGTIHGLGSVVSMSTDGAMSIDGGNWHIFEAMIKHSGARLRLNHTITQVMSTAMGDIKLDWVCINSEERTELDEAQMLARDKAGSQPFDTVIVAAPLSLSNITFDPLPSYEFRKPEYVNLYVTLFTSPFRPSSAYFNVQADRNTTNPRSARSPLTDEDIPDSILTTLPEPLQPFLSDARGTDGLGSGDFWSLSTLRVLDPANDGYISPLLNEGHIPASNLEMKGKHYLYKIFSPAPITADTLVNIFNWHDHASLLEPKLEAESSTADSASDREDGHFSDPDQKHISRLPEELVSWSHEKSWQSYPYLAPKNSDFGCWNLYDCKGYAIPSLRLEDDSVLRDRDRDGHEKGGVETPSPRAKPSIWLTSPMEEFISTMETSALSGMNIARLVVDRIVAAREEIGMVGV